MFNIKYGEANTIILRKIEIPIVRNLRNIDKWSPMLTNNLLIAYGDKKNRQKLSETTLEQWDTNWEDIATLTVFSPLREPYNSLARGNTEIITTESLSSTLKIIDEHIQTSIRVAKKRGTIKPADKKIEIIIIDLQENWVMEAKQPENQKLLQKLLSKGKIQKIYPIFLIQNLIETPAPIIKKAQYVILIGKQNMKVGAKLWRKRIGETSKEMLLLGLLHNIHEDELKPIYPLQKTYNKTYLEQQKRIKEESKAYELFLNSKHDGTRNAYEI